MMIAKKAELIVNLISYCLQIISKAKLFLKISVVFLFFFSFFFYLSAKENMQNEMCLV